MAVERTSVPCGSCRACCRNEIVVLFPEDGDDVSSYEHVVITDAEGVEFAVLAVHPNGDCVYLGEHGCTIHDRAPAICRAFDCRAFFLSMTRNDRRITQREAGHKEPIFKAARARLNSLSPQERSKAIQARSFLPGGGTRAKLRAYALKAKGTL